MTSPGHGLRHSPLHLWPSGEGGRLQPFRPGFESRQVLDRPKAEESRRDQSRRGESRRGESRRPGEPFDLRSPFSFLLSPVLKSSKDASRIRGRCWQWRTAEDRVTGVQFPPDPSLPLSSHCAIPLIIGALRESPPDKRAGAASKADGAREGQGCKSSAFRPGGADTGASGDLLRRPARVIGLAGSTPASSVAITLRTRGASAGSRAAFGGRRDGSARGRAAGWRRPA